MAAVVVVDWAVVSVGGSSSGSGGSGGGGVRLLWYMDPASDGCAECVCSESWMERARKSDGTDEDCIVIMGHRPAYYCYRCYCYCYMVQCSNAGNNCCCCRKYR